MEGDERGDEADRIDETLTRSCGNEREGFGAHCGRGADGAMLKGSLQVYLCHCVAMALLTISQLFQRYLFPPHQPWKTKKEKRINISCVCQRFQI